MEQNIDIFIQELNEIQRDLEGVHVISNDILIHRMTVKEHNQRLEAVLTRAREVNLKLNPRKTKICQTSVNYVGHTITAQGLKPYPERIQAILDMPTPADKVAVFRDDRICKQIVTKHGRYY